MTFAGLKGHLQYFFSEPVAVKAGDGHGRVLVVGHGDEAEALALVGGEVADDFDVCDGAEGAEHLPEDGFVRLLAKVVDEDAPAVIGVGGDADAAHPPHVIDAHGREPETVMLTALYQQKNLFYWHWSYSLKIYNQKHVLK